MKGKFSKTESRGLPGGPHEQFTYVTGVFMQDMYHVPKAQKGKEQPILYVDSEDDERYKNYKDSLRHYNAMVKQYNIEGNARGKSDWEKKTELYSSIKNLDDWINAAFGGNLMVRDYDMGADDPTGYIEDEYKKLKRKYPNEPLRYDSEIERWTTKDLNYNKNYDLHGEDITSEDFYYNLPTNLKEAIEKGKLEKEDIELLKYYESLGIPNERIGYYNSPDVYSDKVKAIGNWMGKAWNPVYPEPKVQVNVKGKQPLEKLKFKEIPQPDYRIHDYMKMEGMDPSPENRDMWAKMLGIKDYKGTGEQNEELIKRLKEYKKNPIRAQRGNGEYINPFTFGSNYTTPNDYGTGMMKWNKDSKDILNDDVSVGESYEVYGEVAEQQRQEAIDYINSPGYLKILSKNYDNPKAEQKARLKRVSSVPYKFKDKIQGRRGLISGEYLPDTHSIELENWGYKGIPLEEFNHSSVFGRMSNREKEGINKAIKKGSSEYAKDPVEVQNRLMMLKKASKDAGLYDYNKEDFTKEHLLKLKESIKNNPKNYNYQQINSLIENVKSDNDLIWLMNNVAYNDTGDLPIGQKGIENKLSVAAQQLPFIEMPSVPDPMIKFNELARNRELQSVKPIGPMKKWMYGKSENEAQDFLTKMVNSPLFEERYNTMREYKTPASKEEVENYRNHMLSNMQKVDWWPVGFDRDNEKYDRKKFGSAWYDNMFTLQKDKYGVDIVPEDPQSAGLPSGKKSHTIFRANNYDPTAATHELSHASTNYYGLPSRVKDDFYTNIPLSKDPKKQEYVKRFNTGHNRMRTEIKAHKDELAKYLYDAGIYDATTKRFDENDYDNVIKEYEKIKEELKKDPNNKALLEKKKTYDRNIAPYDKEQTIQIFNSFVDNSRSNELPIGKYGGNISKAQSGLEGKDYPRGGYQKEIENINSQKGLSSFFANTFKPAESGLSNYKRLATGYSFPHKLPYFSDTSGGFKDPRITKDGGKLSIDPNTGYAYAASNNPFTTHPFQVPDNPYNTLRFAYSPNVHESMGVWNQTYDEQGNSLGVKELFDENLPYKQRIKNALPNIKQDLKKYYFEDLDFKDKSLARKGFRNKFKEVKKIANIDKLMSRTYGYGIDNIKRESGREDVINRANDNFNYYDLAYDDLKKNQFISSTGLPFNKPKLNQSKKAVKKYMKLFENMSNKEANKYVNNLISNSDKYDNENINSLLSSINKDANLNLQTKDDLYKFRNYLQNNFYVKDNPTVLQKETGVDPGLDFFSSVKKYKEAVKNNSELQYKKQGGNISTEGYKRNSPDVNNPFNVIMGDPSGTPITMGGVDFAVKGVDNLGNEKIMYPEEEHYFPGSIVYETPLRDVQKGGSYNLGKYQAKGEKNKNPYVFDDLVKKYTKNGWSSLTSEEQSLYTELYDQSQYSQENKQWQAFSSPYAEVTAEAPERYKSLKEYKAWLRKWDNSDMARNMLTKSYEADHSPETAAKLSEWNTSQRLKNLDNLKKSTLAEEDPTAFGWMYESDPAIMQYAEPKVSYSDNAQKELKEIIGGDTFWEGHKIWRKGADLSWAVTDDPEGNIVPTGDTPTYLDQFIGDKIMKVGNYVRNNSNEIDNKLRSIIHQAKLKENKGFAEYPLRVDDKLKATESIKENIYKNNFNSRDFMDENKKGIFLDKTDWDKTGPGTTRHEIGHVDTDGNFLIPNQDIRTIQEEIPYDSKEDEDWKKRVIIRKSDKDFFGNPTQYSEDEGGIYNPFVSLPFKYEGDFTENRTRLKMAQFEGLKFGWDATKRLATMEDIEQLSKSKDKNVQDLFNWYSRAHILKMLNTVASNEPKENQIYNNENRTSYAQKGGSLPSYQKDGEYNFLPPYNREWVPNKEDRGGSFVNTGIDFDNWNIEEPAQNQQSSTSVQQPLILSSKEWEAYNKDKAIQEKPGMFGNAFNYITKGVNRVISDPGIVARRTNLLFDNLITSEDETPVNIGTRRKLSEYKTIKDEKGDVIDRVKNTDLTFEDLSDQEFGIVMNLTNDEKMDSTYKDFQASQIIGGDYLDEHGRISRTASEFKNMNWEALKKKSIGDDWNDYKTNEGYLVNPEQKGYYKIGRRNKNTNFNPQTDYFYGVQDGKVIAGPIDKFKDETVITPMRFGHRYYTKDNPPDLEKMKASSGFSPHRGDIKQLLYSPSTGATGMTSQPQGIMDFYNKYGDVIPIYLDDGSYGYVSTSRGTSKLEYSDYQDYMASSLNNDRSKTGVDKHGSGQAGDNFGYNIYVKQQGGSTDNKQFEIYQNYINGIFDEVSEEEAKQVYDKLNRMYYAEAKEKGMAPANYIMTHVIGNK
jgi:hypothetical protein